MQKLIAIASFGGHWIQLQRLTPLFNDFKTTYVSTNKKLKSNLPEIEYYSVKEAKYLHDLVASPTKELVFYESGHRLPPEYIPRAVEWFQKYLK